MILEAPRLFAYYPSLITTSLQMNVTIGLNVTELITHNYTYFVEAYTAFGQSKPYFIIILVQYFSRDLIVIVVIMLLNVLILLQMKEATKRRLTLELVAAAGPAAATAKDTRSVSHHPSKLFDTRRHSSIPNHSVLIAVRAERKKSTMIVLTGVNYILGHALRPVQTIVRFFFKSDVNAPGSAWPCFNDVSWFLVYVSYATPFLFYYFFNTQFKKVANTTFKLVFHPLFVAFELLKPRRTAVE
jgi:hypothetical protein